MDAQNTSQNGLAGAISSAIAPVLSQAQTSLVEDVNDTFGGEGGAAAPVAAPATPSTPAAPSLSTPQPSVQPGFQPAMPIVPSRGGLGNSQVLMKLLENQRQMREQMDTMNRINQSPLQAQPSTIPRGIFGGLGPGINNFGVSLAEPQSGPQYPAQMLAAGGKTEARAVQNQGRGDDTMLVHMTPGEVKGLQQLAMAYGGSLTINPKTGLPEAGFLKSLLPTLIGAGLVASGVGAPMAGFMVGGIEAARTGDIGKGLMAGLGAYGGGSMFSGLQEAGMAAQGFQAAPATDFAGRLSQAGQGLGAMTTGTGNVGTAARTAFMTDVGGGTGLATKAGSALATPLLEPAPMPEIPQVGSNYEGPYKPTKREVVYPGADRDPADSSEFLFFRNTNPYPGFKSAPESLYQLAKGGPTVAAPPEGYVSGRDAEFVYGFQPMSTDMPVVQETARVSRGIDAIAPAPDAIRTASITVSGGDGGDNNTGPGVSINTSRPNDYEAEAYGVGSTSAASQRDQDQQDRAAAAAAAARMAKGGEVNMHNNGFVVDAHTVSELGNGSSNAGMERLAQIGGQPLIGPGDGTSDSIPANIDGIQPARVARDEVYMSPNAVAAYGGGSLKVGEKKLYKLMEQAHASRKKNGRGQSTGLQQLVS